MWRGRNHLLKCVTFGGKSKMAMKYPDDSLALHTDLYQINMVETYWADNMHERKAVFELFFRKLHLVMDMAFLQDLEKCKLFSVILTSLTVI